MADNILVTPGSGTTIAADDVGGVLHQRVKAGWGPDGTYNDPDVASGKAFPVQVRSATGLIPLGEPTDPKSTSTDTTSVSVIGILKEVSFQIQAVAALIYSGAALRIVPQDKNAVQADFTLATPILVKNTKYETVAANQTAQVMGGSGATGDYIDHILVIPATTSPGNVLLLDNATSITVYTGGTVGADLTPFDIPLRLTSVNGPWKVTTAANVSLIVTGTFT